MLCSAVYVSGRELDEAARNSGFFMLEGRDRARVTETILDRERHQVRMTLDDGLTRAAQYFGDQGCVIVDPDNPRIDFDPMPVESTLPPADSQPWPMGDVTPETPAAAGLDSDRLQRAVDLAFSDPEALTAAFLVVHKGAIVAERYLPGIDRSTQLESWSMGKSITATLIGRLIYEGHLEVDQPAPVPAWRDADDPRSAITIRHLLQMSSGLHFTAPRDPDYSPDKGYPDHMRIYTGAIDAFEYSISRPLQFPPGTEGRYRNSDPLTLGYIIRETARALGQSYLTFPQRELFDRIGIRRQVLETDPYGNFLLTGYDYGTARNWARLGLLYLQDGVWEGVRLLPEDWSDFVSTPAPAWKEPVYGAQFWVNGTGEWNLPTDAYFMAGGGGQRTFVVPSHDLVIVRMGHFRGSEAGMRTLNQALAEILMAAGG